MDIILILNLFILQFFFYFFLNIISDLISGSVLFINKTFRC